MNEQAILLGPTHSLVGVYTPAIEYNDVVVILLNSGLIHHVGPSRLYVKIARQLAKSGVPCVRFDLSSIGDSSVREDNLSIYEIATREPIEVMDDLQKRGFKRFILAGICAGAYCAFQTAAIDRRVIGTLLINPQDIAGDSDWESKAWAKRYWSSSLFRSSAWVNLLTGRVNYDRLFRTLRGQSPSHQSDQEQNETKLNASAEIKKMVKHGTSISFITSGKDISQEYLKVLLGKDLNNLLTSGYVSKNIIADADHLFSRLDHQQQLINCIEKWVISISD